MYIHTFDMNVIRVPIIILSIFLSKWVLESLGSFNLTLTLIGLIF